MLLSAPSCPRHPEAPGFQPGAPLQPGIARRLLPLLSLTLLLAACSERVADTHPQQWVSQRQAVFKDFTRTLEPVGLMAREREPFNVDAVRAAAARLQELAPKPWPLFTPDSNYAPTQALPPVWEQPEAFRQAQQAFLNSVSQLELAAQAGTLDALKPAVEQVQRDCKACHDRFRKP